MNGVDLILLLFLLVGGLYGFLRGFLLPFINLSSLVLGFLAGRYGSPLVCQVFNLPEHSKALRLLGFLLIFFLTVVTLRLSGALLRKIVHTVMLGGLDRVAGMVAGVGVSLFVLFPVVTVLDGVFHHWPDALQNSMILGSMRGVVRGVFVSGREHEEWMEGGKRALESARERLDVLMIRMKAGARAGEDLENVRKTLEDWMESPGPLSLLAPESEEQISSSELKLSWQGSEEAASYEVCLILEKDSGVEPILTFRTKSTSFVLTEIDQTLSPGAYWWGIRALDPQGEVKEKSELRRFGFEP